MAKHKAMPLKAQIAAVKALQSDGKSLDDIAAEYEYLKPGVDEVRKEAEKPAKKGSGSLPLRGPAQPPKF